MHSIHRPATGWRVVIGAPPAEGVGGWGAQVMIIMTDVLPAFACCYCITNLLRLPLLPFLAYCCYACATLVNAAKKLIRPVGHRAADK